MAFYERKPSQLFIDLINESNPDFGIGLRQLENTRLTTPKPYPTVRNGSGARVIKAFTTIGEALWDTPEGVTNVDILIVAGGGGASISSSNREGPAGGAGGLIFIPNLPVSGRYNLKVGKGGVPGETGENSFFGPLRALGGGSGDKRGGSGGGSQTDRGGMGSQPFQFGPSGEYGFGKPGYNSHHGGGGGAGEGGDPAVWTFLPGETEGKGGDGLCMVTPELGPYDRIYRFAEVFGTEHGEIIDGEAWFAGGGGSGLNGRPRASGGKGGGGWGGYRYINRYTAATPGTANTGGGGGGIYYNYAPAAGGSGIILIAYNNPLTNQEGYKYDNINTLIDVYPKPGQDVRGKATFYYRRIDLGNFFKHTVVRFDRWQESNTITIEVICNWLNEEYGTEFVPEDFPAATYSPSAAIRTLTVVPESYAYIGSFQFIWNPGKRSLDQIFQSYEVNGLVWDLKHGGESDPRPLMTLTGYGADYSEYTDIIGSIGNGSTLNANTTPIGLLIERFNKLYGTELSLDLPHTEQNGLSGLIVTRVSLPNTTVDEANSERFRSVIAISSKEDSWFGGRILFHYNLR